jgi:uncharacterized protein with GYD domain
MSFYFLLGTLSAEGQRMVHENRDLVVDAARNVKIDGAQVLSQYAVLGRYDFVMMVEADDNDAVARLSMEIGVKAGLHIETMPAIAIGVFTERDPADAPWALTSVERSPEQ